MQGIRSANPGLEVDLEPERGAGRLGALFQGSWMTTPLADNAPVDLTATATSTPYVAARMGNPGNPVPWINGEGNYGADVWVAPKGTRRYIVRLKRSDNASIPNLEQALASVPIPRGARPSKDTNGQYPDSTLLIYDAEFDVYWEIFVAVPYFDDDDDVPTTGVNAHVWGECQHAGRMPNASQRTTARFEDHAGSFDVGGTGELGFMGASGTGIAMLGGLKIADMERWNPRTQRYGNIGFAIGLVLSAAFDPAPAVPPAQRNDWSSSVRYPQGTRHRLPHDFVIPTNIHPLAIAIDDALMRLGCFHQDSSTSEAPASADEQNGSSVIRAQKGLARFYDGSTPGWPAAYPSDILRQVAWGSMQQLAPWAP